eukprot:SAG31_NODE_35535_length_322_cov_0.695067_1_plen_24_part_10
MAAENFVVGRFGRAIDGWFKNGE